MGSILAIEFIGKNWKTIVAFIAVLIIYILFFTIERMSDRIDSLKAELESKSAEIVLLQEEIRKVTIDTEKVKKYFEKINAINNSQKEEEEHNAECSVNTDNTSVINHINELFGFCEQQTE